MDGKFKKNDAENMEQFTGMYSASPDMLSSSRKCVALLESIKAAATISLYLGTYGTFHLSQLVTTFIVLYIVLFRIESNSNSSRLEMHYVEFCLMFLFGNLDSFG